METILIFAKNKLNLDLVHRINVQDDRMKQCTYI